MRFLSLALITCALCSLAALESPAQEWKLVWSDEFSEDGAPDPEKWDYEVGFIRNNESQYYTKDRRKNARVEDGHLIIESHQEDYREADYTSASLITRGKAEWQYGRIEVRAQVPTGRGMWPAIWMLGTNISEVGWPECGEIDIMENVGYEPNRIHANVHTEKYNHTKGNGKGASRVVETPYEKFYTYAVEWDDQSLRFFIDDMHYFTYENEGEGETSWPFDQPFYLIINAAIGGAWGGQQGIDDSIFPQQYLIDYVRVYQETSRTSNTTAQ